MFYTVRAVHKFDGRLLKSETLNKRRPMEKKVMHLLRLVLLTIIISFPPQLSSQVFRDSTHVVQVSCIL